MIRRVVTWVARAGVCVLLAGALLPRSRQDRMLPLVWQSGFAPALAPVSAAIAGTALAAARWRLAATAALAGSVHLQRTLPDLRSDTRVVVWGDSVTLRIATANVFFRNGDHDRLGALLTSLDCEVLVLQEWTTQHESELGPVLRRTYPHRVLGRETDDIHVAIYARRMLDAVAPHPMGRVPAVCAVIDVSGAPVTICGVHLTAPLTPSRRQRWSTELDDVAAGVQRLTGPFVVAGDFNANRHHHGFAELRRHGVGEVHDLVGRTSARTWPVARRMPLLTRLDHVLVSDGLQPVDVAEFAIPGSDHLGILATIGRAAALNG